MEHSPGEHNHSQYNNTHSGATTELSDNPQSVREDEEALALRWRNAILRLTEDFSDAADQRDDLSPILMGALHNALERLLLRGEEDDLVMLEEWLRMEEPSRAESSPEKAARWLGIDRRSHPERRGQADRRSGCERRISTS